MKEIIIKFLFGLMLFLISATVAIEILKNTIKEAIIEAHRELGIPPKKTYEDRR